MSELGGVIIIITGLALAIRAFLLSRKHPAWPNAAWWVRYPLLMAGWGLMAYGSVLLHGAEAISISVLAVSFLIMVCSVTNMVSVLLKRRKCNVSPQ